MGGLKTIKAISDPFPDLKFVPTGGIRLDNLAAEYLRDYKIQTVGDFWLCKRALISSGQYAEIERLAAETAHSVKEIRSKETS